jgi:protein SCO1/2
MPVAYTALRGLTRIAVCAAILSNPLAHAVGLPPQSPSSLAAWPQGAPAPAFSLVDSRGTPRTLGDYRGRVVVVYFGFVHCPDACPAELLKLALVMKRLGTLAARVQVLFISLDPERDTPVVLESYVTAFNPGFVGLTGTLRQVDQAAASFNVQYAHVPVGNDYTIDHSTAVFVLDGAGRLRLVGSASSTTDDFVHGITALIGEQGGGEPRK